MVAASLRAITFTSTAGNKERLFLKVSLTKRLTLFRVTAQPIFLLAVTPSRACARLFACHTTRMPREANFWTASFNARNSVRFRSLTAGGNELSLGTVPPAKGLFCCNANGQVFSTFCSPALDDQATVFAGHSHQETVGPFSRNVAGLKCSFHVSIPLEFIFQEKGFYSYYPPFVKIFIINQSGIVELICLEKTRHLW
jgi:hypothetical protein